MRKGQNIIKILEYLALIILGASFCITPMCGDLKIFMASANQAEYISSNLLIGSFKVWELKSVLSRFLCGFIYKIAVLFTDFCSRPFEIVAKLIYLIIVIVVLWLSVRLFEARRENRFLTFFLLISSFTAMHLHCHMQVEMTTSMICVLAYALWVSAINNDKLKTLKLFCAGLLIGMCFYYKSILIILSVMVVAGVMVYNEWTGNRNSLKRLFIVVLGSVISLGIIALLTYRINPAEFQDMVDASKYQGTLISVNQNKKLILQLNKTFISRFFGGLLELYKLPVVCLGIVVAIGNFVGAIRCRKKLMIFAKIVLWIVPWLFVLVSDKYFTYHYVVLVFPAFIELYECFFVCGDKRSNMHDKFKKVYMVLMWLGVGVYLATMSCLAPFTYVSIKAEKEVFSENAAVFEENNFDNKELCMYLDDGEGAYRLGNPSYLRHFFPLPIQRLNHTSGVKVYWDTIEKAMQYNGKYVSVQESFIFGGKNPELKQKLDDEYTFLFSYETFSAPHSVSIGSIEGRKKKYDVYVKREENMVK